MSAARRHDGAGASARAMADRLGGRSALGKWMLGYAAAFLIVALVLTLASGSLRIGAASALLVTGLLILLTGKRARTDADRWKQGAAGERATAAYLRRLTRQGYTVLHDRKLGGNSRANVDHLVIGPHGVAILDSKKWNKNTIVKKRRGRTWAGRSGEDRIAGSLVYERSRVVAVLERELGLPVVDVPALLVIHGPRLAPWRSWSALDIPMLQGGRRVRRWIKRLPVRLDPAGVARFVEICERRFPPYVPAAQQRPVS